MLGVNLRSGPLTTGQSRVPIPAVRPSREDPCRGGRLSDAGRCRPAAPTAPTCRGTCRGRFSLWNQSCPDAPTCPDTFCMGIRVRVCALTGRKGTFVSHARILIEPFCRGVRATSPRTRHPLIPHVTFLKTVGACRGVGAALIYKGFSAPTCRGRCWGMSGQPDGSGQVRTVHAVSPSGCGTG